jgi:hypothetical protein
MKMQGFLGEEDFYQGNVVLVEGTDKEFTVISVERKHSGEEVLLITDWKDVNGPYWEKAENCFKKEQAPIHPPLFIDSIYPYEFEKKVPSEGRAAQMIWKMVKKA